MLSLLANLDDWYGPFRLFGYVSTRVVAAGAAELSGRLACPERLGQANAADRAAFAAYDVDRVAQHILTQKNFTHEVSKANTAIAAVNLGIASVGLAASIAKAVTAVSIALNSAGVGVGVVVAAAVGIGGAVAGEVAAIVQVVAAGIAQAKAEAQAAGVAGFQATTAGEAARAVADAVSTSAKGLNP